MLSGRLVRRSHDWRTSVTVWADCLTAVLDRRKLANEVERKRLELNEDVNIRSGHPGLAERLAIEAALINRGLLRKTKCGWF